MMGKALNLCPIRLDLTGKHVHPLVTDCMAIHLLIFTASEPTSFCSSALLGMWSEMTPHSSPINQIEL